MKEGLTPELMGIAGGLATVELGPDVVHSVFGELTDAAGADIEFMPGDIPGLENFVEAGIDCAQGVAVPVAAILIMYAGMKHMFKKVDN